LGDRKGIWPVKTEWWGDGMVVCLERGADLHMAQLMPLPLNVSCFSKIQIGFTFLVPAHTGSPRKRAVKRVCVCVCLYPKASLLNHVNEKNQGGANETGFICTMAVEMWVVIFLSRVVNSYVLMHNPSEIF